MELLETQDPEKRRLIETSERHKRELEREVNEISARTQKMVTNALIIGGSLLATYLIVNKLGGSKKKKKKVKARPVVIRKELEDEDEDEDDDLDDKEVDKAPAHAESSFSSLIGPTLITAIGTRVINQATYMLLDLAREKVMEYLSHRKETDENS